MAEGSPGEPADRPPGRPRWSLALAGVLVVAAVVAVSGLWRGEESSLPDAGPDLPRPPTPVDSAGPLTPAGLIQGLRGTIAIAVSEDAESARIVTWDVTEPAARSIRVDGATRLSFDASGGWVAGLAPSAGIPGTGRLYVGRTGGLLLPLTRPVRGFSWHDTSPAQMAFALDLPSGGEIHQVDLRLGGTVTVDVPALEGSVLTAWGDWGFALTATDPARQSTAILDPEGRSLIEGLPGGPVGAVGASEVAFAPRPADRLRSDAPRRGFLVDTTRGVVTYPSWSGPGDIPVTVAVPPGGGWLAALSEPAPSDGRTRSILLVGPSGETIDIAATADSQDVVWDPSGRWLAVASIVSGSIRIDVIDSHSGEVIELPAVGPVEGTIDDIAVIPG